MEASRRRLFERGESEHPLTGLKLRVLAAIADLEIATPAQLAGMTAIGLQGVQRHLRDLFDMGLVERSGVPRSAFATPEQANDHTLLHGRAPTIYAVSKEGKGLLLESGAREQVTLLPRFGPKNTLFLAHEVQVRDVRVWLERAKRRYGHEGVTLWETGRDACIGEARPDALFVYRIRERALVGIVEVDRGTEKSPARWKDKFQQYAPLFLSDHIKKATGFQNARVIIVTPDPARTQAIGSVLTSLLPDRRVPEERYWITERKTLDADDLSAPAWWVPERSGCLSLVPDRFL